MPNTLESGATVRGPMIPLNIPGGKEMQRRMFVQTAAKLLAISPWLPAIAKAEPSTTIEGTNGSKGGINDDELHPQHSAHGIY
jgi:hypothetical protein